MPRTRPLIAAQPATRPHAPLWPEVLLLVGYFVICLLSILTVLMPTTENEEEHVKPNAAPVASHAK